MRFGGMDVFDDSRTKISGILASDGLHARVHTMPECGWDPKGTEAYPGGEYYEVDEEQSSGIWKAKDGRVIPDHVGLALIEFASKMRPATSNGYHCAECEETTKRNIGYHRQLADRLK